MWILFICISFNLFHPNWNSLGKKWKGTNTFGCVHSSFPVLQKEFIFMYLFELLIKAMILCGGKRGKNKGNETAVSILASVCSNEKDHHSPFYLYFLYYLYYTVSNIL